jgi:hypothetical protein
MALVQKNKLIVPESAYGVCMWEIDGAYLSDGYLSLEGRMNDPKVEDKMRKAAKYWTGLEVGSPVWVSGARKVSYDEWEDQRARLLDGEIPDEVEAARQSMGLIL